MSSDFDEPRVPADAYYRGAAPEAYNRAKNPSLKNYQDFVRWLREKTISNLAMSAGDMTATKGAFIHYFRRGLQAGLLMGELMDQLSTILIRADYPPDQSSEVIRM